MENRSGLRILYTLVILLLFAFLSATVWAYTYNAAKKGRVQTAQTQEKITPIGALLKLKEGNKRFMKGKTIKRNLVKQAKTTSKKGQFPFAVILSCMDSRGSPELIFDQGIGDIFSLRVAGNVLSNDMLGSMEFAVNFAGSKLIVVMGHTHCGAVHGACEHVKLGHLTDLVKKIDPSIKITDEKWKDAKCDNPEYVNAIAKQNALWVAKRIPEQSLIIRQLLKEKKIDIVAAIHDLKSGKVTFYKGF